MTEPVRRRNRVLLLYAALPPLLWAAHGDAATLASGLLCGTAHAQPAAAVAVVAALSLLAAACTLAVGWRAWRAWRGREVTAANARAAAEKPAPFLALAATLLSVLALAGIVYATLPLLLVDACGAMR